MFDYTEDPEGEILNRFFGVLSNADILKTRDVSGLTKTTTFYYEETIESVKQTNPSYYPPIICVDLGDRIDDEVMQNSIQNPLRTWVVIDSSVAAGDLKTAKVASRRLQRNIKQVILNKKHFGNMIICSFKSFRVNPYQNNELSEVTWRTFVEVDYK